MPTFEALLEQHLASGGCDCLDHLREVGLTPPRTLLGTYQQSKAWPSGQGPRAPRTLDRMLEEVA